MFYIHWSNQVQSCT